MSKIQSQIIQSWDILATLTPSEYIEFRDSLGQASGFQSYQYRMIEYALGYKTPHALKIYEKDPELHARLHTALHSPSLYDVAIQALVKKDFQSIKTYQVAILRTLRRGIRQLKRLG